MVSEQSKNKIRIMQISLAFSCALMAIKFAAYFITNSNAVLSDALESIINITAGSFALFSIYYASKPKDADHPYGHGKIENLSAGFEGALIFIAGASIIAKAGYGFFYPNEIAALDAGLALSGFAGICNFFMGYYLVKKGEKYNSMTMVADGKHLISDTVSSIGLVVGLSVMFFTKIYWIDNAMAVIFGAIIFRTGYQLIKESITDLLDEADTVKLNQVIKIFNDNRRKKWIDIHNLRVLKHGSQLHVDCHLTLPWYDSLEETHKEVSEAEILIRKHLGDEVEFFIHADPCLPACCSVCILDDCKYRKQKLVKKLEWNLENIVPDTKHKIN